VSQSGIEVEYKSIELTASELLWIQSLLHDLGVVLSSPSKLWIDNIGATIFLSILFFRQRPRMWKLISTLIEIELLPNRLKCVLFQVKIKWAYQVYSLFQHIFNTFVPS
jgi:hypothetical protein